MIFLSVENSTLYHYNIDYPMVIFIRIVEITFAHWINNVYIIEILDFLLCSLF